MNNKIIEIVVFLANHLNSNKKIEDIDFSLLLEQGYSMNEINSAIAWVYSKLETEELLFRDETHFSNSKRIFDKQEKKLLSVDSQGYLMVLLELGIITESELDLIIEKIRFSGMENLSLDDVKIFVSSLIFNKTNPDILEHFTLDNNQTIH
jgi:uncharacterized protein Smg (DUF494 family)